MCNVGSIDQLLRILSGVVLLVLAWFGPDTSILSFELLHLWKLGWLGLIPLLSGLAAFCPIYAVLGLGHRKKPKP